RWSSSGDAITTECSQLSLHDALPIALRVPALRVQINVANACLLATPVTVALICRVRVIADVFRETIGNDTYAAYQCHSDGNCERSEEHTSAVQSLAYLVCRLLLEKNK